MSPMHARPPSPVPCTVGQRLIVTFVCFSFSLSFEFFYSVCSADPVSSPTCMGSPYPVNVGCNVNGTPPPPPPPPPLVLVARGRAQINSKGATTGTRIGWFLPSRLFPNSNISVNVLLYESYGTRTKRVMTWRPHRWVDRIFDCSHGRQPEPLSP